MATQFTVGNVQSPAILAKLGEVLFIEAVRRYLVSLSPDQSSWIAGLRDPVIGRTLALLHGEPDRRWTANELARAAGLSRSTFADRFTSVMGETPMRYLEEVAVAVRRARPCRDARAGRSHHLRLRLRLRGGFQSRIQAGIRLAAGVVAHRAALDRFG